MHTNFFESAAHGLLEITGNEPTETNLEQAQILVEALEKFIERDKTYKGLWEQGGMPDSLHHLKSKVARLGVVEDAFVIEDTCLDIIVFAAFHLRHARHGRMFAPDTEIPDA